MFSRFFIDRPIFAAVLSIFFVIAGLSAMRSLPIAQYPEIAPPVVSVVAVYPGASAEVIEQTVAAPLENAINGVEKMIYMSSTSTSNGVVTIQVTFDIGTNVDQAAQVVNNRVKQAEAKLPQEVRRQGVTVEKGSSAFLQVLAFYSDDGSHNDLSISNYVTLNVLDMLKRVPGTTNVQIFGAKDYAMRIWVQPDRLSQLRQPLRCFLRLDSTEQTGGLAQTLRRKTRIRGALSLCRASHVLLCLLQAIERLLRGALTRVRCGLLRARLATLT